MSRFRITLMSPSGASERIRSAGEVTEELRHIGLEWKQADYFHDKRAVIIVEPYVNENAELMNLRAKVAAVADALGEDRA